MKLFINFSYYQTNNLHVQLISNNSLFSYTFRQSTSILREQHQYFKPNKASWCIVIKYVIVIVSLIYFLLRCDPVPSHDLPWRGFVVTLRHTTPDRTTLDEWSARHRDLYLTTSNTHKRHPCPQLDSNPQSQQASGRRFMPYSERPLGSAIISTCYHTKYMNLPRVRLQFFTIIQGHRKWWTGFETAIT